MVVSRTYGVCFTALLFQSFLCRSLTFEESPSIPQLLNSSPIGYPKVNQDFVCLILGERRYMSPNDAKHQSLRPCYRTRQRHPPRKVIKYELIVCLQKNGAPRVNQDFVCLLWGEGERSNSKFSAQRSSITNQIYLHICKIFRNFAHNYNYPT